MKNITKKIWAMSKLFVFISCLQTIFLSSVLANSGHSQSLNETRIECQWNQAKLENVFSQIQQQTDYFFTYDRSVIERVRVSGEATNIPLGDLLFLLSGKTGLHFNLQDGNIYVFKGEREPKQRTLIEIPSAEALPAEIKTLQYQVVFQISTASPLFERMVKGTITDASGVPLIGAAVSVQGTTVGTVTDMDGSFSLAVPDDIEDPVLVVTYIGFETQEVALNNRTEITIVLQENTMQLDEVVVIGYGTGTKEKFNGAVSKVDDESLNQYSAASFDQAIAGRIAGVQISGNNKNPGDNSVIQIRGLSTLTAGTNPLIVVDGNPLTEGSTLSSISTQDIESIDILKDAASAAIYGSRASNGVILITTKKGEEGRLRVTYDGYVGFQERIDEFQLADAYGTARFDYDARNFGYLSGGPGRSITDDNAIRDANGGGKRSRIQSFLQDYVDGKPGLTNTNWEDAVLGTAPQQNHYLNFSGGSSNTNYSISFGYFDADNIVVDSDYERYTNNFQLNAEIRDNIRFGISSNVAVSNANPVGFRGWSDFNLGAAPDPALAIILMHPYYPIYNEDGSIAPALQIEDNNANWDGPISGNVVATMTETDYTRQDFRVFGTTFAEIDFHENLTFKTSFGGDFNTGVEEFFAPSTLGNYRTPVANSRAMAFKTDTRRENYIVENLLTYDNTFGNHGINFLVGHSYQQELANRVRLESQEFTDDNLRNIAGATNPTATNVSGKWALESLFTRLQYDYASRYSISGSFRRDGFFSFRWPIPSTVILLHFPLVGPLATRPSSRRMDWSALRK